MGDNVLTRLDPEPTIQATQPSNMSALEYTRHQVVHAEGTTTQKGTSSCIGTGGAIVYLVYESIIF